MRKILIKNIKTLVQVDDGERLKVSGMNMKKLPCIHNAWLAIENDKIVSYGTMDNWGGVTDWSSLMVIDATNKLVMPCYCDSHTHIVYAGSREGEFVGRINGLTYEQIFERGGGILNSAKKLSDATEEELIEIAEAVFRSNGAELVFEQEGNIYYACLPNVKTGVNLRYSSPASTMALAAFAAEQRYLVEEEATDPELKHNMPGDTYLEKAQNRIAELQAKGIVPASEHPKFKSEM